jgi:hypothetical protein
MHHFERHFPPDAADQWLEPYLARHEGSVTRWDIDQLQRRVRYQDRLFVVGPFTPGSYATLVSSIAKPPSDTIINHAVAHDVIGVGVQPFITSIPLEPNASQSDIDEHEETRANRIRQAIDSSNLLTNAISAHHDVSTYNLPVKQIMTEPEPLGLPPSLAYAAVDSTIIEFEQAVSPTVVSKSVLVVVFNDREASKVFKGLDRGDVSIGGVGVFREAGIKPGANLWEPVG